MLAQTIPNFASLENGRLGAAHQKSVSVYGQRIEDVAPSVFHIQRQESRQIIT
jgi:hypothetical protein